MPFGYLDTQFIDFPIGVDVAYLQGLENEEGVSFADVLRSIDDRLRAFNNTIDALVANLVTPTTEAVAEPYGFGAIIFTESGEYVVPRPQDAGEAAHLLPIRVYDAALGFTEMALRRVTRTRLLGRVDRFVEGLRLAHRRAVLTRLFDDAEIRVERHTTATSPGFIGSGTGDNVFQGTTYADGSALPGGYTHYFFADTDNVGDFEETLEAAIANVAAWHPAPLDMIASSAALALVMAIPDKWFPAGSALVRPASGTAEAMVDAAEYAGVYQSDGGVDVRVRRAISDTATSNLAIFKTYGNLDPRNPLAWRYRESNDIPNNGRGAYLRYRDFYPLSNAILLQEFGIGVNDRTAAALVHAASGAADYVVPTWA